MEPFILSCLRCEFEGMEGRGLAPSRGRMRVKQMEEVWQDDDDSVNVCFFFSQGCIRWASPSRLPWGRWWVGSGRRTGTSGSTPRWGTASSMETEGTHSTSAPTPPTFLASLQWKRYEGKPITVFVFEEQSTKRWKCSHYLHTWFIYCHCN